MTSIESRLLRLERNAAAARYSPERAAQARQTLLDIIDKIGLHEALDRLERRATAPLSVRLRDTLRRVLER